MLGVWSGSDRLKGSIERYKDAMNLTEWGGELMTLSFGPDVLGLMLLLLYWDKSGVLLQSGLVCCVVGVGDVSVTT